MYITLQFSLMAYVKKGSNIFYKCLRTPDCDSINSLRLLHLSMLYEGWKFNSGNYLFTTDTK